MSSSKTAATRAWVREGDRLHPLPVQACRARPGVVLRSRSRVARVCPALRAGRIRLWPADRGVLCPTRRVLRPHADHRRTRGHGQSRAAGTRARSRPHARVRNAAPGRPRPVVDDPRRMAAAGRPGRPDRDARGRSHAARGHRTVEAGRRPAGHTPAGRTRAVLRRADTGGRHAPGGLPAAGIRRDGEILRPRRATGPLVSAGPLIRTRPLRPARSLVPARSVPAARSVRVARRTETLAVLPSPSVVRAAAL